MSDREAVIDQLGIDLDDNGLIETLDSITGRDHRLMRNIETAIIEAIWEGGDRTPFNMMVDAVIETKKKKDERSLNAKARMDRRRKSYQERLCNEQ